MRNRVLGAEEHVTHVDVDDAIPFLIDVSRLMILSASVAGVAGLTVLRP
jgi:hypothetical protein